MPMRCPIPKAINEQMNRDPFMKRCCLRDDECSERIERHHSITFCSKRLNEAWAILPVCSYHHRVEARYDIGIKLLWIALNRATDQELIRISKAIDYLELKKRLNKIYAPKK